MAQKRKTMGYCRGCKTMQLLNIDGPKECPVCTKVEKRRYESSIRALDEIAGKGQLSLDLNEKKK